MEKRGSENSWSMRNIPDEIWPEILSTLPVKYLLRFRSVSPSWRALIDSPDFARLHLTRFPNYSLRPLVSFRESSFERRPRYEMNCTRTDETIATLDLTHSDPHSVRCPWVMVFSIDGLFMLHTTSYGDEGESSEFILWNPSIRKSRKLPPPPKISVNEMMVVEFGFGFDPSLKDYKYVRLGINRKGQVLLVQVYTVRTNSWRSIDVVGCLCFVSCLKSMKSFYLKGVLYTLASGHSQYGTVGLVSFDLSSEVFASTRLPIVNDNGDSRCHIQALSMISGEDSLVFVDSSGPESRLSSTVWVTENLGADFKSLIWTQRYPFFVQFPWNNVHHFLHHFLNGIDCFLYLKKKTGELLMTRPTLVNIHRAGSLCENLLVDSGIVGWQYIESLLLS